ncbi:MAG: hypothetical protein ACXU86_00870 [Archangium sp.]
MKWRTLLGILAGLLLPVPLAWMFDTLLPGGLGAPRMHKTDSRLVPQLSAEERSQLLTYLRPCGEDRDCDAPLVCLRGVLMMKSVCISSQCATDLDCSRGFSCRSVPVGPHMVRLCGVQGRAREGEWCLKMPPDQEAGCAPGLVCANGQCRLPCRPEEPPGCPEGFFCGAENDVEGPACLPTCEGRSCPEGQQCVRLDEGASICARVHGPDCQRAPCPAEQQCEVSLPPGERRGEVWTTCTRPCDERGSPCPDGFMCIARRCRQRCEPGVPGACGPEKKCTRFPEREFGLCTFDFDK